MLYKKACAYCETNGIFSLMENARGVIVGFSGGADSAVLLSFFDSLKERFPRLRIIAAHVNHMIRGEEAKRDAAFAEGFCIERGIDFELLTVDVPAEAKEQGLGLEEAARNIRYDFFDSLCKKHSADLIATAHNSDDNLETVIMNLMRGSGTKGASGIAPIRDGRLIRPLICCTGEEIRSFARQRSIPYVQDSTNLCTDYSRNAVRHRLVPLMRESNPKVAEAALRLSQAAREDCDFIEGEAKKILSAGPLSRKALAKLHPALFQRVLLELYKKEAGTALN
ncbi:MAG: tRNA lysidine(34) synthetase TilS, partial [Clostridia bacterium]|nr:tRNA lysidine(34) synthetase TilS [Clostridia bacterium]